ncbi:MAG: hypothetical protein Q9217_001200 [Psora testacea]
MVDGYQPPPPPPPKRPTAVFDATDLTTQFEQLLRARRLNNLSTRSRSPSHSRATSQHRHSSRSSSDQRQSSKPSQQPHAGTPSSAATPVTQIHTSCRNYPMVPMQPQDERSWKFRNNLVTLSHTPIKYENPGLLDEALTHIPLDRIYGEAEDESQLLQAEAASLGWGKRMSYCIAFSTDGATDVTRRYVRNHAARGADRNKCPEEVLLFIIQEIRRMRRENTLKDDRKKLLIEDEREERELRGYVVKSLAAEIGKMLPNGQQSSASPGEQQKLEERQSGTREWREARGEAGTTHSHDSSHQQPPPPRPRRRGPPPPGPREGL